MYKLIFAITISVTGAIADSRSHNGNNTVTAAPDQINGYYIFANSKPVNDYAFLGSVKANRVIMSGANCFCDPPLPDMLQLLIKQARKKFDTTGNAIIYTGGNECQVIKLK